MYLIPLLPQKKERRWLIIDNFNHITNEVVETMSSTVSGGHRLFLIASHDEFNSPSISMHSKVSYIRYVGDLLTSLLLSFISISWLRNIFGQMGNLDLTRKNCGFLSSQGGKVAKFIATNNFYQFSTTNNFIISDQNIG